jgi:hypothetical protein
LSFRVLERFVAEHGHARVPAKTLVDGCRLGAWINAQRTSLRRGTLSAERRARLEAVSGWTWDPHADDWEEGFQVLQRFAAENGHARLPAKSLVDGFRLGQWINVQRTFFDSGRLSAERIARLEAVPGWTWNPYEDDWETWFRVLERFVVEHGTARVLLDTVVGEVQLGQWVGVQRANFSRGKLSAARIARLEALNGWTWDPHADDWEEGFQVLQRFAAEHGHARVPAKTLVDGFRLGAWVNRQRSTFSKGRLSIERAGRLEKLSGWAWKP